MNTAPWINSFSSENSPTNYLPTITPEKSTSRLHLEQVNAHVSILRANPFSHGKDIQALHPLGGEMPGGWFCYPSQFRSGSSSLHLYMGCTEKVDEELKQMSQKPKAVVVSPWIEPFLPEQQIQEEMGRLVNVLSNHGVQSWFMTRGFFRSSLMKVLARHADLVRIRMGFTTLDRSLQKLLEPWGSSPSLRLKQLRNLQAVGIKVQVALEPMLPGITDTRENLVPLLEAFADMDIHHISAGYQVLQPRTQEWLQRNLQPLGLNAIVVEQYEDGIYYRFGPNQGIRLLAKNRRQRGYAALMSMAAGLGIQVGISTTSNPDFTQAPPNQKPQQARLNLLATSLLAKVPRG